MAYLDDSEEDSYPNKFNLVHNPILKERNKLIKNGGVIDFCMPLHVDVFQASKLIPPNVDLKFCLTRNNTKFGIITAAPSNWNVKLLSCKLQLRKILAKEKFRRDFEASIIKSPATFSYPVTKIITRLLPSGATSTVLQSICQGRRPRGIIIGLLRTEALSGFSQHNPFFFYHFNCDFFQLRIDGVPCPSVPFMPDFTNKKVTREYRSVIDNCGIGQDNISTGYRKKDFLNGKTLFCVDLTPDKCNGFHLHESKFSNIDLEIHFSQALTESVQVVVFSTYNGGFILDDKNQVTILDI